MSDQPECVNQNMIFGLSFQNTELRNDRTYAERAQVVNMLEMLQLL